MSAWHTATVYYLEFTALPEQLLREHLQQLD